MEQLIFDHDMINRATQQILAQAHQQGAYALLDLAIGLFFSFLSVYFFFKDYDGLASKRHIGKFCITAFVAFLLLNAAIFQWDNYKTAQKYPDMYVLKNLEFRK